MKNNFLVGLILFVGTASHAVQMDAYSMEFYAPIVQSRTSLSDAQAGTIVFDNSSSAFYGLPVGGNPATANNWVAMSAPVGSSSVASSGDERIERARITCGSASSAVNTQSGTWISSVSNGAGAGLCTVNFTASKFSAEPSCSCTIIGATGGSANGCFATSNPTTSSIAIARIRNSSAENGDLMLICMGPK